MPLSGCAAHSHGHDHRALPRRRCGAAATASAAHTAPSHAASVAPTPSRARHKLHAAACAVLCGARQELGHSLCAHGCERIRGTAARRHRVRMTRSFAAAACPPSAPSSQPACPPSCTAHPVPHTKGHTPWRRKPIPPTPRLSLPDCRCERTHLQLHAATRRCAVARASHAHLDGSIPAALLWESPMGRILRSTPFISHRPTPFFCQLGLCGRRWPRAQPRACPTTLTRPPLPPPCAGAGVSTGVQRQLRCGTRRQGTPGLIRRFAIRTRLALRPRARPSRARPCRPCARVRSWGGRCHLGRRRHPLLCPPPSELLPPLANMPCPHLMPAAAHRIAAPPPSHN